MISLTKDTNELLCSIAEIQPAQKPVRFKVRSTERSCGRVRLGGCYKSLHYTPSDLLWYQKKGEWSITLKNNFLITETDHDSRTSPLSSQEDTCVLCILVHGKK